MADRPYAVLFLCAGNSARSIARSLSDTFAGIAPAGVAAFVGAQLLGMLAAVVLSRWLWPGPSAKEAE